MTTTEVDVTPGGAPGEDQPSAAQPRGFALTDLGPVVGLINVPAPLQGGIGLFRGGNGVGKTQLTEAIDFALTSRGKPSVRRGAIGGTIEGFGQRINVGLTRSTRKGELEVETLDGGIDIGLFISPPLKDPAAADRTRIKVACLLAGVKVDLAPFAELVGGLQVLQRLASPETLATTDPVELAESLRLEFHEAARAAEDKADSLEGTASGLRQAVGTLDLTVETDERVLQAALEAAVSMRATLRGQAEGAERAALQATDARRGLDRALEAYKGPSIGDADAAVAQACMTRDAAADAVAAARAALQAAEQELAAASSRQREAQTVLDGARQHAATVESANQALAAASQAGPAPTAEAMERADAAVTAARGAVESGAVVRRARTQALEAQAAAEQAQATRERAELLRSAARGTDEVLAGMLAKVAPAGLSVREGRLVVTSGTTETYLAELSPGQRGLLGVLMFVVAAPEHALLTLNQVVWEGLDGAARVELWRAARRHRVMIYTASADHEPGQRGPLRFEMYLAGREAEFGETAASPAEGGAG